VSESDRDPERPSTVHVIVTCANRKSLPIPSHLQLGEVPGSSAIERVHKWIARLADTGSAPQAPAFELYAGEHWSVARRFSEYALPGEEIRLWACSAGYGLIPAEARIMPYHATLTPNQADSVPRDTASWWTWLNEWPGPSPEYPRSIQALVASDPAVVFMFVLSKNYLRACGDDIAAASEHIANPNRLLIVSAGARLQGDLAAFAVPADARLQSQFGGTRRALNARIGGYLLSAGIRGKNEATANLSRLLAAQPRIPRYDRKKQTDREILDLIAQRLSQTPATSAHRLLREFRDTGLACEQHRFSRLYRTVAEATS
jgi:murein DD-endopeptidase MepM/ murein hydrolase activator NlpD